MRWVAFALTLVTGCSLTDLREAVTEDMLELSEEDKAELERLKVESAKVQMQNIKSALQLVALKNRGKYPSTTDGLESVTQYLANQTVPVDPWGNDYLYLSPATASTAKFDLISWGSDGKEGGTGSAADLSVWGSK